MALATAPALVAILRLPIRDAVRVEPFALPWRNGVPDGRTWQELAVEAPDHLTCGVASDSSPHDVVNADCVDAMLPAVHMLGEGRAGMHCRRCRRDAGEEDPDGHRHYEGATLHLLLSLRSVSSIDRQRRSQRRTGIQSGEDGEAAFTPPAVYVAYRSDESRFALAAIEFQQPVVAFRGSEPVAPGSPR